LAAIVYVLARASSVGKTCDPVLPGAPSSVTANGVFDIGAYREKVLSQSQPFIIECAEADAGGSQESCHMSRQQRYASLNQKGITIWMTGLSGSGKSTIASLLEQQLVLEHGKNVYRLDGDNIRTGLNRDLGFSKADRGESVRRVGELSCLFNDAGLITIVSLVSPYKADRDLARKRHEDMGLKFMELFMDVPLKVVQDRDPKGLYKKVAAGELKGFTGVDDPYEAPTHPELSIKNQEMTVQESVDIIKRALMKEGVLTGGPTLPQGLPYPDGDEIIDLVLPPTQAAKAKIEADTLPKALLTDIDVNWLHTIGDGWAAPLKGFMREGTLLQTIHFNSMLVDPFNITGNYASNEVATDFLNFDRTAPPKRVSMSVPIVLPITAYTKQGIESSGKHAVTLVNKHGKNMAILRNPEIYENRKEEIVSRIFGVIDPGHPYIEHIYSGGDWLLGGEIELLDRIEYNDGLDKWRLNAPELMKKFEDKKADAVFAFQTRNPTHAGHAYLMKTSRDKLLKAGYDNPVLWLSPLGGWTKSDDVPLDVRVKQHEAVLDEKMLDPETTVMAIWPAPMIYGGPTEVLFHAKSRRNAGATYFVAGRDPAGMKGSPKAGANPDEDLYNGDHGRYVLTMSPGQDPMNILPFAPVSYDKRDNTMKAKDPHRLDDFIDISGTKMRTLAKNGAVQCPQKIPSDLIKENCVPPGFMVPSGWDIVSKYYQDVENEKWVPYSIMVQDPLVADGSDHEGQYGTHHFKLYVNGDKKRSPWHDIPLKPDKSAHNDENLYNMVIEIPMYSTAKMEMNKEIDGNSIMQDEKNGKPRYYTYGVPFFNYGFLPQTWEDVDHVDPSSKAKGDGDPIDVIELGEGPLGIGTVVTGKILGSMELIDEGETDHKIIMLRSSDPHFHSVDSMADLERVKPGITAKLDDWLTSYKTSDGKPENKLTSDTPTNPTKASEIVDEVHRFYNSLVADPARGKKLGYSMSS
jgi:3'-phosphoadenosine 5'-phosphosulfate synthase